MELDLLRNYVSTTETAGRERHLLLENFPALLSREWLPSEEEWPELADLRREHERLLTVCEESMAKASKLNAKFSGERDAQRSEMETAMREGRKERRLKMTPPEEQERQQRENIARIETAVRLLAEFCATALDQIKERASDLYTRLAAESSEVEKKRREAERLLAEADEVVRNVQRKELWLAREATLRPHEETGEMLYQRTLPPYPFGQTEIPPAEIPGSTKLREAMPIAEDIHQTVTDDGLVTVSG